MLLRINEEKQLSHLVLRETLAKLGHMDERDKALIKRLTEGTIERLIQLDYIINRYSKIPVLKMKPLIRNLLRMSVYQIIYMDNIPGRAACSEAVKLAEQRKFANLKGFINGILRNIIRHKNDIQWPDENDGLIQHLSIRYSMPEWLVEKWLSEYDIATLKAFLSGLLKIRPVTVRLKDSINPLERKEWLDAIKTSGIDIKPHPYLEYAYDLSGTGKISALPGYTAGLFTVQDVSSMLVCEAADIGSEDIVIDICAAPGGKALHAADKAKSVIALDISEAKCDIIKENAARLKISNIEISTGDASALNEALIGKADILLADLPCSGLGIIGRKPDIKHKASPESLAALSALQKSILAASWQYVKPGGTLIYSTCTLNRDENEAMLEWFVENHPFIYDAFPDKFPHIKAPFETKKGILKLLPGIHQTDGFFICRLKRKT